MTHQQLIDNHQRAIRNASQARLHSDRKTCFDLVAYYAKRIRVAREAVAMR